MSLVFLTCLITPGLAGAKQYPHKRDGFLLGLGVGIGSAGADVSIVENLDRETDVIGSFRIGWALVERITLALDFNVWRNEFRGDIATDVTWTFSLSTVSATVFPGNVGFFIRGGIGVAAASAELNQGGGKVSDTEAGLGLLAATGYEWRVTETMAVGPQVNFAYLNLNGAIIESVEFISFAAQVTWYR